MERGNKISLFFGGIASMERVLWVSEVVKISLAHELGRLVILIFTHVDSAGFSFYRSLPVIY